MRCRFPRRSVAVLLCWFAAGTGGCAAARWRRHEPVTPLASFASPMTLRETFETVPALPGDPPRLVPLSHNVEAWAERWRMISRADDSLEISTFVLRDDVFGISFLGVLGDAARRGVRIRLLLDAYGTAMSRSDRGREYLAELADAGDVEIKVYRPIFCRVIDAVLSGSVMAAFASEHDKIIVRDGRESLIGGRNLSSEYFADPDDVATAFRDLDVVIDGRAAADVLHQAFRAEYDSDFAASFRVDRNRPQRGDLRAAHQVMDSWLRGEEMPADVRASVEEARLTWIDELEEQLGLYGALYAPGPRSDVAETRIVDSQTRLKDPDDAITQVIFRLLDAAQTSVFLQSPYFVLSDDIVEALARAGRRGVAITVLTNGPSSGDNALSQAYFYAQWPEVLARVPNLRLFVAGDTRNMHGKLASFDDTVTLVGTYNLDPFSAKFNSEVVAAVWSPDFADAVLAEPRALIASGAPATYEYRIERDGAGSAVRDPDGKPIVVFGPGHHFADERWPILRSYRRLLRAGEILGVSPFF